MPDIPPLHQPKELHARHDRVRLTVLLHRKQGMSTEDFQKYWRDEHSQLFANLKIVKRNLLTYEQVGVVPVLVLLLCSSCPFFVIRNFLLFQPAPYFKRIS